MFSLFIENKKLENDTMFKVLNYHDIRTKLINTWIIHVSNRFWLLEMIELRELCMKT